MKPFYDNWASSSHARVNCIDCHYEHGFSGYIAGKIRLLSEMLRYWVGAYNVRPHSRVSDQKLLELP
jgi:nitrate/TMAO reductase-like tetraheme cytochrome c subunit